MPIAPSMGGILRVQVPSQVFHDERSEVQLHEGDRVWEGSVEHNTGILLLLGAALTEAAS